MTMAITINAATAGGEADIKIMSDDGNGVLKPLREDRKIIGWEDCDIGCCTFPIYEGVEEGTE